MRRITAVLLSILLAFTLLLPLADQAEAAKSEPAVIRVQLRNYISNRSQISVKIDKGSYSVAGNPLLILRPGHNYEVKMVSGQLSLYDGSTLMGCYGTAFELIPARYGTDNVININGKAYIGAMTFSIDGAYVRPINKLMLEDYLKGVVPYEMPASWGKEALKAQAIAARTYAMRCLKPSNSYDVLDTTANQVYGGYIWNSSSYSNSNAAVEETRGIVLEYDGSPALTEYSSSNGGWVEQSAYSAARQDPYDLWNPQGKLWTECPWAVTYSKAQIDPAQINVANVYLAQNNTAALDAWWNSIENTTYASRADEKAMIAGLKSLLASKCPGKDIRITEITDMTMDLSKRTAGQRLEANSSVTMTVKFLARDAKTKAYDLETVVPPQDPNNPLPEGQIPQPVTVLKVSKETLSFTVTQMRTAFGANRIKSYLISSFTKDGNGYIIAGKGYGHGRGMSQYGAMHRAKAGEKYTDILNFYYPVVGRVTYSIPVQPISISGVSDIPDPYNANAGDLIISYSISRDANVTVKIWDSAKRQVAVAANGVSQKAGTNNVRWDGASMNEGNYYYTVEVADSAGNKANACGSFQLVKNGTPGRGEDRPTPTPTTQTGTVKVGSTLNVRSGAGTQYKVVGSLKNGTKVEVLGESGSWYKIKYGSITGYVSGQYLVVSGTNPAPTPTPPSTPSSQTGTVKVGSMLNVRSGAGTQYKVVGSLKNGTKVEVLGESGSWYKIKYGSITGYVSGQYLVV
ncbi:SpoIID/LytB domain-containing protein [Mahella australiensis]|uniref:SpoIID/LytB domain protein n=1 Tax=Mahella australiensis (strain DSM 15567 / CIP 107919 / 50-1 BON) TaxID=697281 RepID=F3ZY64_MAHA5|nr:SpoIID/LytB domain-containing protein [Mahella australiensis]AEE95589.1 SpoIID/LytB domain protein [Mahella australiensis 50-1 BON]